jgi:hypothetical protein
VDVYKKREKVKVPKFIREIKEELYLNVELNKKN